MDRKQKYMSDYIREMNNMQRIVSVEWVDWDDMNIQCGVEYTDVSGKVLVIPLHAPDNICSEYTECDFILNNLMMKKVFSETGAEHVPDYPLNVDYATDVVRHFRMSKDPDYQNDFRKDWKREKVTVRDKAHRYYTTEYQIRINPAYSPAYMKILRDWKTLDEPFSVWNTWGVPGRPFMQKIRVIESFTVVICLDNFDLTGQKIQSAKEAADALIESHLLHHENFGGRIVLE